MFGSLGPLPATHGLPYGSGGGEPKQIVTLYARVACPGPDKLSCDFWVTGDTGLMLLQPSAMWTQKLVYPVFTCAGETCKTVGPWQIVVSDVDPSYQWGIGTTPEGAVWVQPVGNNSGRVGCGMGLKLVPAGHCSLDTKVWWTVVSKTGNLSVKGPAVKGGGMETSAPPTPSLALSTSSPFSLAPHAAIYGARPQIDVSFLPASATQVQVQVQVQAVPGVVSQTWIVGPGIAGVATFASASVPLSDVYFNVDSTTSLPYALSLADGLFSVQAPGLRSAQYACVLHCTGMELALVGSSLPIASR